MKKLQMALAAVISAVVAQMLVPCSVLAESASPGHRTITVTSQDASAGTVTLSFGGAAEDRILFMTWDVSDKGDDPSSWAESKVIAYIQASENSYVCPVPLAWRRRGGAIRFFLGTSSLEWGCPVDYIRPTRVANNLYYDTGIKADRFTALTLDCQVMEGTLKSEKAVIGVSSTGGAGFFTQENNAFVLIPAGNFSYATAPSLTHSSTLGIGNVRHSIEMGYKVGLTLDGNAIPVYAEGKSQYKGGYENETSETIAPITLFMVANNSAGYSAAKNSSPDVRIYGLELRKSGTPVMRLRPCIQDGVLKFYDEVGGGSLPPSDASGFTYGEIDIEAKDVSVDSSAPFLFKKGDFGRSISIAYGDDANTVELQFGGSGEKILYVAHDLRDKGADPKDWADVMSLGHIGAETTSYSYVIPEDWRGSEHVLRFFLSSRDEDYDELYQWIYTGTGSGYFDTQIVPTRDTVVTLDMQFDDNFKGERGIFGFGPYLGMFTQENRMFVCLPGLDTAICNSVVTKGGSLSWGGQRKVLRIGKSEFSFDGVQQSLYTDANYKTLYTGSFDKELIPQTTRTMPLFKLSNPDNGSDVKGSAQQMWLYSCDIVTNGVPARRFFAAKKDGSVCLYDDISKTTFKPNSVATFSVGGGTRDPDLTFERSETSALLRLVRSVGIRSFDQLSNSFTLSFGGVAVENALFAVYDERGDRGSNPQDWSESVSLGMIPANVTETNLVGVLPRRWLRRAGAIRFLFGYVPFERKLEWVSNNAVGDYGQYVLPDYRPNADFELTIRAQHQISDYVPFGISKSGGCSLLVALPHSGGHLYAGYFGGSATIDGEAQRFIQSYKNRDIEDTPVYELRISRNGVWFPDLQTKVYDGFTTGATSGTDEEGRSLYPLCLFGTMAEGAREKYKTPIRIYSVLAREADTTVLDLIPCVKKGEAGFYDKAHGVFLGNTGSGSLIAGPDDGSELKLDEALLGAMSSPCEFSKLGLFIVIK